MTEVSSASNASAALSGVAGGRIDQRRRRGKRGGRGRGSGLNDNNEHTSGDAIGGAPGHSVKQHPNQMRREQKGGRGNPSQSNDTNDSGVDNGNALPGNAPLSPRTEQALQFVAESLADSNYIHNVNSNENSGGDGGMKQSTRQNNRKARSKKKSAKAVDDTNKEIVNNATNNDSAPEETKKKKRSRNRKPKQRKDQKSYPWKKFIPDGAEDPISLDPLEDLPYPPFALVVDEPYVPIYPGMWPPQQREDSYADDDNNNVKGEANRELQILKEQWGDKATLQKKSEQNDKKSETDSSNNIQGRRFNLFDGRALANYVVSELQFIDPFNRRDLTRPELQALDAYLAVHKLGTAGVVEAYDDNGTTISTAGAQAQTPGGRALMLQQRAQAIRDALYQNQGRSGGHHDVQDMRRIQTWQGGNMGRENEMGAVTNYFQRMYVAHERGERGVDRPIVPSNHQMSLQPDTGIYAGDDGGFLMIDDDINPGLRSRVVDSTRVIAERNQEALSRDNSFPLLENNAASEVRPLNPTNASAKKVPVVDGHSKSLSKISKMIKQTDPKEIERQRKAREEANRRAKLSRQMFFDASNPNSGTSTGGLLPVPKIQQHTPSEAVLERNRNLAFALGVAPSTIRNEPCLKGWARPTNTDLQFDEFGNELNAAQYPDALLAEAKERMNELVKLEKQWQKFLADDKEASCSLKAMQKPLRKFVHEYSDFWRLHTESFDPEGRRYIYCKKMADTAAPYPLLSDAARKWRGPAPTSLNLSQPFSTTPISSDGWRVEGRVPLKLAPRTINNNGDTKPAPIVTGMGMTRSSSTPFLSMTGEKPPPPRFATLGQECERPKLQLAKRQIPAPDELDKRNITPEQWEELDSNTKEQMMREIEELNAKKQAALEREKKKIDARIHRKEHKAKKKQDVLEKKQALMERAFASDDDDDDDTDNDWFESDIAFDGSDDEGR